MSIRKTIGGDRLGSGKKMKVDLKSYERSTHDLSHAWRSTMAAGTLVPFLSKPILPGSTWDIDLNVDVRTHPTIGPLFGSYKVQMDLFLVPMRLYIARLHNNESGLGMDMKNVHIPQLELYSNWRKDNFLKNGDNSQINPSSLLSYLGIRGVGVPDEPRRETNTVVWRTFNAIPYLAYWEIYKNYYANQQEEIGAYINTPTQADILQAIVWETDPLIDGVPLPYGNTGGDPVNDFYMDVPIGGGVGILYNNVTEPEKVNVNDIYLYIGTNTTPWSVSASELFTVEKVYDDNTNTLQVNYINNRTRSYRVWSYTRTDIKEGLPTIDTFPLKNIDLMKREILTKDYSSPLIIGRNSLEPYNQILLEEEDRSKPQKAEFNQQSLALKTYQNDIFNNWMNTEWIDGENGINSITAVQIVDDKLEIPSLILARKVFNVLNRIALSGGTYDDWLEVTYDHQRVGRFESPAYMGGLIKELVFEEVISQSAGAFEGEQQPLGTLAGQGRMSSKHKGGKVVIKTDEPAYVIGLISITPRIDYSQGNDWDVNLKNMDELHKPELDAIGFQDLITDQMAWFDTIQDEPQNKLIFKSAGKQPAWINYQTAVNKTKGNFAVNGNQMWMTLNRMYEIDPDTLGIKDLTSYIDPVKYNHVFAHTTRDAQNFWVNAGIGITARQKMSAKVMPNL